MPTKRKYKVYVIIADTIDFEIKNESLDAPCGAVISKDEWEIESNLTHLAITAKINKTIKELHERD